jgi:catechol 2,3-dioxygenase-like lactoylglutathione lyase family enzyme
MLDHVGIATKDYEASKTFYTAALAPIGIGLVFEVLPEETGGHGPAAGFGSNDKPYFWFGPKDAATPIHLCFTAQTRAQVDAFYAAALAAGAKDNGAPGVRPLSPELLRRLRHRPERGQPRSGLSQAGVSALRRL